MADFIPFEHDVKGRVGVGQTLSIRRHDEGLRRHSSPNILAFSASHRIWVLTQVVMTSPPSSSRASAALSARRSLTR